MKVRPSVIIVQEDCVLTMRYMYAEKEVLALPGGNPDPGECLPAALKRELFEELGVIVEIGNLAVCGEVLWTDQNRDTLHMVYLSKITEGFPILNEKETTALQIVWVPLGSLKEKLLYPNIGRHIMDYVNGSCESVYVGIIDQPFL